jgi:hypothetical protein
MKSSAVGFLLVTTIPTEMCILCKSLGRALFIFCFCQYAGDMVWLYTHSLQARILAHADHGRH